MENDTDFELENGIMDENLAEILEKERELISELEFEQELEREAEAAKKEAPERKKLKRELEQEALARLEASARTSDDFLNVTEWWDRLDSNRERRERYHEVGRDEVPLEWGASPEQIIIPDPLQHVYWKQILKGEFLDAIFDCPFEMHELVEDMDISNSIKELKDVHKELLYYLAIRQYSCQRVACMREQTDRNIRKVRDTILRKLRKKYLAALEIRIKEKVSLCKRERDFVEQYGEGNK